MSGRSIPLSARIMAVADVFDALYAERCYKKPIRPVEKAMDILLQGRGTQFDAEILDVFVGLRRVGARAVRKKLYSLFTVCILS